MTRTLRTVRAHTVDGAHQLVVVDDAGAEHIFTASVTGMEFIHALDVASAGITLGDDENTQIAKDVFDRVLEDITTWTVLDPEFWWAQRSLDGQPEGAIVDHDEIYALRIQAPSMFPEKETLGLMSLWMRATTEGDASSQTPRSAGCCTERLVVVV